MNSQAIDAKLQQALALHQRGQLGEAEAIYRELLAAAPAHFDALHFLGVACLQTGRFEMAVEYIGKAIALEPDQAGPHSNLGIALSKLHRLDEALASYNKALSIKPDYAEAHFNRGNALAALGRPDEALASYNEALALRPDYVDAYLNRGNTLLMLQRPVEAIASYDQVLALRPGDAVLLNNRGSVLAGLHRHNEALASYDGALSLAPHYAEAHYNRGVTLMDLERPLDAIASYDNALQIDPGMAKAWNNRGNALQELRRTQEALASYDKALALAPDNADAYNNRGNALRSVGRLNEALASYRQALSLQPESVQAWNNLGYACKDLNRLDEARASFEKALALAPHYEFLFGIYLHVRMMMSDWESLPANLARLEDDIEHGKLSTTPFATLSLINNPRLHRKAAETYAAAKYPARPALGPMPPRSPGQRIRIGYFSADFAEHAVSCLMAELFELHDTAAFEVFAFSTRRAPEGAMVSRLRHAFEHFIEVHDRSDREVAELSREVGLDIAIDLGGFTADGPLGIFSYRAAPVQVSYIGYLGTTGSPYVDYLIADRTIVPASQQQHYAEKILYLPSYQVNDRQSRIADRQFTRAELGLPEAGFVFCCFNNGYKILPGTFDSWMRVLQAVGGSTLLLLADNEWLVRNLRAEAEARGVNSSRLVFAPRIPREEHLARCRACDLFLDTFPCNAGITASDALWAGLPVLTRTGESFASRVAASLLNAIELPELITASRDEYESKAIMLALNPAKLAGIKQRLATNRMTTALFDSKRFAARIEMAYRAIHARRLAGLSPESIESHDSGLPLPLRGRGLG